jgi:hypothetical protein
MTHAALYWLWYESEYKGTRWKMMYKNAAMEEDFVWVQGWLVCQFWNHYHKHFTKKATT